MIEMIYFDKGLKKGNLKDFGKLKNKNVWVDIKDTTKEEKELIEKTFKLHPLTSEDLINPGIRIKVEEFQNYLFGVFYGIKEEGTIKLNEIDFVLGKNFIITNYKGEIEGYEKLKNDSERLSNLLKKGSDFLFHKLLDMEIDNYFPVLEKVDDFIEELEGQITRKTRPELLMRILKLKRLIVYIKKSSLPQREHVGFLAKNEYKFISKEAVPYFRDIYDHAIRVSDTIENYREGIGGTFDAYMSAVSNNMNEVMKVLSIIATIALPLGVISGIYGTNFAVLPGQNIAGGFWFMVSGMAAVVGIMILLFKRKGWF